jgi:hypothetical protein
MEWTSVKDRLPEGYGRCIALWANGSVTDVPEEYIRSCKNSGLKIYWMPLPAPPKEDK